MVYRSSYEVDHLAVDKIRTVGIATNDVNHAVQNTVMAMAIDFLQKTQVIFEYII